MPPYASTVHDECMRLRRSARKEVMQGGPKRCIHFIIAIISKEINPGFYFSGKS
jgi:hypothetical protein